jgi:hypothetical protein
MHRWTRDVQNSDFSIRPTGPGAMSAPEPSFARADILATQECDTGDGATAPSRDVVNAAALVVYRSWCRHLSHCEAIEQAARFARRFRIDVVLRIFRHD